MFDRHIFGVNKTVSIEELLSDANLQGNTVDIIPLVYEYPGSDFGDGSYFIQVQIVNGKPSKTRRLGRGYLERELGAYELEAIVNFMEKVIRIEDELVKTGIVVTVKGNAPEELRNGLSSYKSCREESIKGEYLKHLMDRTRETRRSVVELANERYIAYEHPKPIGARLREPVIRLYNYLRHLEHASFNFPYLSKAQK